jgi:hypothetical protein
MKIWIVPTCRLCGRPLKTRESIKRGVGPECLRRDKQQFRLFPEDEKK